ncbi:TetR/AcrR family transcriptional regulator [Novosphingobium sp.]|uniref:TetR/AcrR family transcriptional regulator n=1 Tax=Novosphingobium sp. TaxID=1874826 RepID=UPI003BA888F7
MTTSTRKRAERLSPEQRRAEIVAAARELTRERGFDQVGMGDVARAVGVVEGAVYRYFPSKDALLLAVVSEWYERALEDYDRGLRLIEGCRNQLRYMVWRHLDMVHRDPDLADLVFKKIRALPNYRETVVYDLNQKYTILTTGIVRQAMETGELNRNVPLRIVRDLLFGSVEHHCFAYIRGEGDFSPVDAAEAIVDIVYRGLQAPVREPAALDRLAALTDRLEAIANRGERT